MFVGVKGVNTIFVAKVFALRWGHCGRGQKSRCCGCTHCKIRARCVQRKYAPVETISYTNSVGATSNNLAREILVLCPAFGTAI